MLFRQVSDERLAQYAYLIGCQQTGEALIIDPERDIDRYLELAQAEHLRIVAVAETHIHADFLSGAREFAERVPIRLYLSDEGDEDWKYEWVKHGNYNVTFLEDGDTFTIGNIEVKAVHTPGHTPEHMSFMITDCGGGASEPMGMVTGDFVFVGDLGRPDLLESAAGQEGAMRPSAMRLFRSARRFLDLPDYLQVWPGHGAGSACGKALGAVPESTVGYERRFNPALRAAMGSESDFVDFILAGQPEPPLYFARTKQLNRDGPPVLGRLPAPHQVFAPDVARLLEQGNIVLVDTRVDREAFLAGHLPGSLYAPFDKSFPTVVGSYIDPDDAIYLIIGPEDVENAVRSLVRIGYDDVAGYVAPETLEEYERHGGRVACTESIDFREMERLVQEIRATVLDVRGAAEYELAAVPGALNIAHTRLADRLDEVPRDHKVLVHCETGARASVAAALLEREGFDIALVNDVFANTNSASSWTVADTTPE